MSKINCNVIRDILPLYLDKVVSDDTKAIVEEHLASCPECTAEAERLEKSIDVPASEKVRFAEVTVIKKAKKKLFNKKVLIALCSLVCASALFFAGIYLLFVVKFTVKYDPDVIKIKLTDCNDEYDVNGEIIAPEKNVCATCGLPYASFSGMGWSGEEDIYVFSFNYSLYDKYFAKYFDSERYNTMVSAEHEYKQIVPTDFVDKIYYSEDLNDCERHTDEDFKSYAEEHAVKVWEKTE